MEQHHIYFIWKVEDIINQKKQIDVISSVRKMVPSFEKAVVAKNMREKYCKITALTPVVRVWSSS